jgi:hypothetical protein
MDAFDLLYLRIVQQNANLTLQILRSGTTPQFILPYAGTHPSSLSFSFGLFIIIALIPRETSVSTATLPAWGERAILKFLTQFGFSVSHGMDLMIWSTLVSRMGSRSTGVASPVFVWCFTVCKHPSII